jgi:hypothetical protein
LHLTSTAYDPRAHIGGSHAQGYSIAPEGRLTDTTTWTRGIGADGDIVSNADNRGDSIAVAAIQRLYCAA